jgi:superoxide dismutase
MIGTHNVFEFKALPYSYDALEPFIDKLTVEIHYGKHHKAYYDNFINAIKGTAMESMHPEYYPKQLIKHLALLKSSKNNSQMQVKPVLEVVGHGYVWIYVDGFWDVVNWDVVTKRYENGLKSISN